MRKQVTFYTILIAAMIAINLGATSLPIQAQEPSPAIQPTATGESLDTILAQATAKSFLITLTRPDLAGMIDFYVSDRVKDSHILDELQEPPATEFEIAGDEWVSQGSYRVKAVLQPGNRDVALYIGSYAGQWLVENIERLPASASPATPTPASRAAAGPAPVSGNGPGFLVFQTQSGGDIYFIKADGTGLRRLTHGIDPQLSPDGTQVAFTRWDPEYELFTINVDGSGEQSIAQGWRQMKSPTWSADGTRLVFSYQSGGRLEDEHVRINLEKEALEGKRVRIPGDARNVEVKNGILTYIIPMDAHWYLKQITPASGAYFDPAAGEYAYAPTWFPTDPNRLIYQSRDGLGVYDEEINRAEPLTADFDDRAPVISPDGGRIAVTYWQNDHWEIHTMNIDGSQRQRLTETPITVLAEKTRLHKAFVDGMERVVAGENPNWNNAAPAWSPDGRQIAFVTDRAGRWEIWIMPAPGAQAQVNADGSNQRPMFPNGALDGLALNYAGVDERMISWRADK
jgi:hypothetical protein